MGIKTFNVKIQDLSEEYSFRFDFNFLDFNIKQKKEIEFYTFNQLFNICDKKNVDLDELEIIKYAEIGDVEKTGDANFITLNFEERNELNENYFKKIEKGDIISPNFQNILISSVRPNLKKFVYIDKNISKNFFTKAFIELSSKFINPKVMYYALKTIFYQNLISASRQGKGYPTLKKDDLKYIIFKKNDIDNLKNLEDTLLKQIEPIENRIKELKGQIKDLKAISDKVFDKEFNINWQKVFNEDKSKIFYEKISEIPYKNDLLRTSYRWNKLENIQKELYFNIDCIEKLGKFIKSTKNGWSPKCDENSEGNPVLGIDCIKNGQICLDNLKYTPETRNNIEDFYIKENDFFVSRGNTIELVALAGVVEQEPEQDIIYSDLMIKVEFDEKQINKKYIAYLFNSSIGRLYFKYSAKGKNQTMVKISSKELLDFYLPIPDIKIQEKIVKEIKQEFKEQEKIKLEIETERKKIDEIIERGINNG